MDNNIIHEAISILQCCEEASSEDHVKTALGVAIGMLLSETDHN